MSVITIQPEELENTLSLLNNQIRAIKGRAEGRDLSNNEKRTLSELEQERDATERRLDECRRAPQELEELAEKIVERRELLHKVATEGKVIHTFGGDGPKFDNRGAAPGRAGSTGTVDSRVLSEFRAYLRGEQRAFTSATSASGAAIVPQPLLAPVVDLARAMDPISKLGTWFDMSGGNSTMKLPRKATHASATVTNDFTTARTDLTTTPTFASRDLVALDYFGDQAAERRWVQSTPGAEDLILRWSIEDIYETFAGDIATGDGDGNATGLFTDAAVAFFSGNIVYTGTDSTLTAAAFVSAFTALHPKHRAQASWLMNGSTLAAALALDAPNTASTTPLVTTGADGVMRILGRPVLECSNAPDLGVDSVSVALMAPEAYALGTHASPEVLVDIITSTPMIRYKSLARLAGNLWNPEACSLIIAGVEESA